MSLVSLIKDSGIDYSALLNPLAQNIKTLSKNSVQDYKTLRTEKLSENEASRLGTAFDLAARVLIANKLGWDTTRFINENRLSYILKAKGAYAAVNPELTGMIERFLLHLDDNMRVDCLSTLNVAGISYRKGILTADYSIPEIREELIAELEILVEAFKSRFVDKFNFENVMMNVMLTDSFTKSTSIVDMWADGMIIDFKTTFNPKLNKEHWLQVVGYYISNMHEKVIPEIKLLAIYKASFGELEYVKLTDEICESINEFADYIGDVL